jgi:hypothetical protein
MRSLCNELRSGLSTGMLGLGDGGKKRHNGVFSGIQHSSNQRYVSALRVLDFNDGLLPIGLAQLQAGHHKHAL